MKQKKSSDQQTQSIIKDVQDTHGYSIEIHTSDTKFIGVASPRNAKERWTGDPNPNLPMEREMTVLEAEQLIKNSSNFIFCFSNFLFYYYIAGE